MRQQRIPNTWDPIGPGTPAFDYAERAHESWQNYLTQGTNQLYKAYYQNRYKMQLALRTAGHAAEIPDWNATLDQRRHEPITD